ncbi:MAG: PHP domain-containing protein [Bdellovibrionaceae bacterium]|nr:PHP domain-containing protein [Pseudobdellovibrionaceae bacterium]
MWLADLHVHSIFSDGQMTIAELVDFYGARNFGCIAITDHICEDGTVFGRAAAYLEYTLTETSFSTYLNEIEREAARAWDQYRLVVLPGYELSKNSWSNHRSAHILGVGVSKWQDASGDVVDLARGIRAQGGVAIAAHPVSTRKWERQTYHLWSRREELSCEFDAWEVASGPHWFTEVAASGLPMIATSDLHRAGQITAWKSVFVCERHPDAILDAIREQNVSFQYYEERAGAPARLPARGSAAAAWFRAASVGRG